MSWKTSLPVFLSAPTAILLVLAFRMEFDLLAHLLLISAVGIAYVISIFGYGSLLIRAAGIGITDGGYKIAATLVSGLAVLYVLFIFLNLTGLFIPLVVIIVVITGAAAGVFSLRGVRGAIFQEKWTRMEAILLYSASLLAGIQIVFSWTPLIFYDAIQYHILAPLHYLKAGTFVYIPLNFSTNMPISLQLVFGSSAAFDSSGEAYKFLTAVFGLGMAGAVALAVKEFGRLPSLLAALLTLGCSGFWLPQTLGVVDLPIAALMLTGTLFLQQSFHSKKGHLVIAGFAFGIAIGSRYPASLMSVIIFLISGIDAIYRKTIPATAVMKTIFLCGIVTCLMVAPWIVKNLVFTGNPVYPLFQKQLNGYEWSAQDAAVLRHDTVGNRFHGLSPLQKFSALFSLLTSERILGWILLICGIAGLFFHRNHQRFWVLCLTGWVGLLVWGWIHPLGGGNLTRFNAVTLLFFIATAAVILSRPRVLTIAGILATGFLVVLTFLWVNRLLNVLGSVTDSETRRNVLRTNVPAWEGIDYANRNLDPETSKVFFLGETRSFYLKIPSFASDAYHGTELAALFAGGPEQWHQKMLSMGITHILLSVPELNRLQGKNYLPLPKERLNQLATWLKTLPFVFRDDRGTMVFALPAEVPSSPRSRAEHAENNEDGIRRIR